MQLLIKSAQILWHFSLNITEVMHTLIWPNEQYVGTWTLHPSSNKFQTSRLRLSTRVWNQVAWIFSHSVKKNIPFLFHPKGVGMGWGQSVFSVPHWTEKTIRIMDYEYIISLLSSFLIVSIFFYSFTSQKIKNRRLPGENMLLFLVCFWVFDQCVNKQ